MYSNAIAFTSLPASIRPIVVGRTSSFPRKSSTTAAAAPIRPVNSPSTMNGPRTNQFEAPTSFITSISRRRAKIESRIVLPIRIVAAISRITIASADSTSKMCATRRIRFAVFFP